MPPGQTAVEFRGDRTTLKRHPGLVRLQQTGTSKHPPAQPHTPHSSGAGLHPVTTMRQLVPSSVPATPATPHHSSGVGRHLMTARAPASSAVFPPRHTFDSGTVCRSAVMTPQRPLARNRIWEPAHVCRATARSRTLDTLPAFRGEPPDVQATIRVCGATATKMQNTTGFTSTTPSTASSNLESSTRENSPENHTIKECATRKVQLLEKQLHKASQQLQHQQTMVKQLLQQMKTERERRLSLEDTLSEVQDQQLTQDSLPEVDLVEALDKLQLTQDSLPEVDL